MEFTGIYEYKKDEDGTFIARLIEANNSTLILPSEYNGIPVSNVRIMSSAKRKDRIVKVIIPGSMNALQETNFHFLKNLSDIEIESGIKIIGKKAFENCKKLVNVKLPDTITTIGLGAFHGCSLIRSIELPRDLKKIDRWAFFECKNIQKIKIPDNAEEIYPHAFRNCEGLEEVHIGKCVKSISCEAFGGCFRIKKYFVDISNDNYQAIEDCIYSKDGEMFLLYPSGKSDECFKIKDLAIKRS